ncbi:hypothetical protein, partial [Mycobacterium marinum]|uniref:hypothetical protein n=1 Tax=Mycobacterium marinum TaxID=1781 RepID=UPI0021C3DF5C
SAQVTSLQVNNAGTLGICVPSSRTRSNINDMIAPYSGVKNPVDQADNLSPTIGQIRPHLHSRNK